VVANAKSGTYGAKVTGAAGVNQVIDVEPNTEYTLTTWGKASSGHTGNIGVNSYGGAEKTIAITTTSYTKRTVTFTTRSFNTTAKVFVHLAGVNHNVWVDDFKVVKTPKNSTMQEKAAPTADLRV